MVFCAANNPDVGGEKRHTDPYTFLASNPIARMAARNSSHGISLEGASLNEDWWKRDVNTRIYRVFSAKTGASGVAPASASTATFS